MKTEKKMSEVLEENGVETKLIGGNVVCRCPICKGDQLSEGKDHNAQVNEKTLYCFTEKKYYTMEEVVQALKQKPKRKEEPKQEKKKEQKKVIRKTNFEFKDIDGNYLYTKTRIYFEDGTKDFSIPDNKSKRGLVLYGLERLKIINPEKIMIAEGEKCADAVNNKLPDSDDSSVCLSFNNFENEWKNIGLEAQKYFKNKPIIIFQDNDETGRKNTDKIAKILKNIAKSIIVVDFQDKKKKYDIADWLEEGGTIEEAIEKYGKQLNCIVNIDILSAFQNEPAPLEYVTQGFVVGTVGVLVAPGGTGKTFLMLGLAMDIASSANKTGLKKTTGRVVYYALDNILPVLKHRLFNFGKIFNPFERKEISQNLTIKAIFGSGFDIIKEKENVIAECDGAKLIVFDTLSRIHTFNENDNSEMAKLLSELEYIALQTGAAVLIVHHASKAARLNGTIGDSTAGRGASAIVENGQFGAYMETMTIKEAGKKSIKENRRGYYVKYGTSKLNNDSPEENEIWFERKPGGILERVDLKDIQENETPKIKKTVGRPRDDKKKKEVYFRNEQY